MGRKKKSTIKNRIKSYLITLLILAALVVAERYGILAKIDEAIRETGLKNVVDTSSNVVVTPKVKRDEKIITSVSENIKIDNSKLNILFLNVGQADCSLIMANGYTVLIDAGNNQDGEKIVSGLKALGIEKLDFVIGTHVHEDHIGGMSYIINSFDVGKFYLPYDTVSTGTYYKKLLTALTNKNMGIEEAVVGEKILLGDASLEIMSVDNTEPENQNISSIVTELTYGDLKYLFMGDAETENEKLRSWNDVDLIKVGHHGSNTSSSAKFLEQVLPEIAIISVGKDNSYGLPKDKIINRYNSLGSKIYRTDEDGTIQIISDGKTNEVVKIDISFDS